MSNQQGDNPGAPPPAPAAGSYGPGHTVLGAPAFAEEASPFAPPGAFPPAAPGAFPPPAAPMAGAASVPATIADDGSGFPPPAPPPAYPASPYAAGAAPPPYAAPSPYAAAPAPNPYAAPLPAPPRARSGGGGPPLAIIGVGAFLFIGGLTTFLALRGRGSSNDDKPIPTIDVPPPASVPADPGGAAPSAPDPGADPPPADAPPPPAAAAPAVTQPKATPKPTSPTVPTSPKPTATATGTVHPPVTPTPTTPPGGSPQGPKLGPRHPIPRGH
jgi:hypothetical protein